MKKNSIMPFAAIAIGFCGALILVCYLMVPHTQKFQMPSPESQVKVVAPAHEIPPQVAQNMQDALAEREKKLQELQNGNASKAKLK
jgi:hypothetical protein